MNPRPRGIVVVFIAPLAFGCVACAAGGGDADREATEGGRALDASRAEAAGNEAANEDGKDSDAMSSDAAASANLVCDDARVPSDPINCGRCGHDCTRLAHLNGAVSCDANGECSFSASACAQGWAHCSSTADDGCETDVTQASSCGSCGHACSGATPVCSVSFGVPTCTSECNPAGMLMCGASCVDTANDPSHCGNCGTVCPAPPANGQPACASGACAVRCDSGYEGCGGACTDVETDGNNCGGCDVACPSGTVCENGQCGACPNAELICDGQCVNEQLDRSHCGGCTTTCGAMCVRGACVQPLSLSAGAWNGCAIMSDGALRCWTEPSTTPLVAVEQPGVQGSSQVAVGYVHTCVLAPDGTVQCWQTTYSQTSPEAVVGLTGIKALAAGDTFDAIDDPTRTSTEYTCALSAGGTVSCWGVNTSGELGDGTTTDSETPVAVSGITGATAIAAGGSHACALLSGGSVRCWGLNTYGELGNGRTVNSATPVAVTGIANAVAIAVADTDADVHNGPAFPAPPEGEHTCAILSGGAVSCWGLNASGELGDGTTTDSSTPVTVSGLAGAIAVAAGSHHTCALLSDGTVRCWGANDQGQLGDGTTNDSPTPVAVAGLTGATALVIGGDMTCVVAMDGSVQCWGYNGPDLSSATQAAAPVRTSVLF